MNSPSDSPSGFGPRTILALRLDIKTGWALHRPGGVISSGSVNFAGYQLERFGKKYARFSRWLGEFNRSGASAPVVRFVIQNRIAVRSPVWHPDALLGVMAIWCERCETDYGGWNEDSVRHFACGDFSAPDRDLIQSAVAAGFHPKDAGEAMAIHLLRYSLKEAPI